MSTFYSVRDNRGYRLKLEITQVSQSIDNNTSSISYALYLENEYTYFASYQSTGSLVINGSTVWSLASSYSLSGQHLSTLLKSGTATITHNADGTKTLSFSASFKTNVSGSYGTTETLSISDSLALTTIPRASDPTVNYSSRALGEVLRITTNRASTGFTHTLKYKVGSSAYITIETDVGAYYDWTLPNAIANYITSATSGTVTIQCLTYSGATLIGTEYVAFTSTIPNTSTFKPSASIDNINVVDGLGAYFVQGKSKINAVSSGVGKYGASISQYKITIDGSNYYGSNITSGVINKDGSITITLRVTDSRGYYSEITQTVTFQPYYSPKITTFTANRNPAQSGIDLNVVIDFDIAPIANQNSKYYAVSYRETGGSWIEVVSSTSYYTRSITHSASGVLDANKSYEVKLELRDSYNTSSNPIAITKPIGTVFKLMNFNASGKGMAIGKYSEINALEVALKSFLSYTEIWNNMDSISPHALVVGSDYGFPTMRMHSDNHDNTGIRFRVNTSPTDVDWSHGDIEYNKDGDFVFRNPYDAPKLKITKTTGVRIIGFSTGNSNMAYISFMDKNDSIRHGYVGFGSTSNSDMYLQADASGSNVRVRNPMIVSGAVDATAFNNTSERSLKKDIQITNNEDNYFKIKGLKVYEYNLKSDFQTTKKERKHIGLMTDNAPKKVLSENGNSIDLYSYVSVMASALQETIKKVEALEQKIKKLEDNE